ncbi:MAG: T9SS type A sorting domain-containing protein [Bacteroidia bacterium]|nr:T9SS type A sorting domain-containing protein [Bacteroidia bacterium]
MQKLTLILIITFALTSIKVHAQQPYKKLIPTDNISKVWGFFYGVALGETFTGSRLFPADTNIAGKSYRRYGNNGFMREDSISRKVYFLPDDSSQQEFLLYDFSLNLNDSFYFNFKTTQTSRYSNWYRLDSVYYDTITPFGRYYNYLSERRKIFRFKSNYSQYRNLPIFWVEGLGSNMTPLYSYDCFNRDTSKFNSANGCFTSLLCVVEGVDLKFQAYPDCLKILHVSVKEIFSNMNMEMYPNPANELIHLSFKGNAIKFISYEIKDINGRKIYQSNGIFSNDAIDVSSLPNGFYLLYIKDLQTKSDAYFKFMKN